MRNANLLGAQHLPGQRPDLDRHQPSQRRPLHLPSDTPLAYEKEGAWPLTRLGRLLSASPMKGAGSLNLPHHRR